jgi:hypothetical protein
MGVEVGVEVGIEVGIEVGVKGIVVGTQPGGVRVGKTGRVGSEAKERVGSEERQCEQESAHTGSRSSAGSTVPHSLDAAGGVGEGGMS